LGNPRLSAKSNSTNSVHDQVKPKHLEDVERNVTDASSNNGDKCNNEGDSELENDELLDVLVELSSPHQRVLDILEG
jgi:hypothetical protein